MMDPELLANIIADPDNDDRRLVLADWLEENGEPERSEFVRVQIELAKLSPCPGPEWCNGSCRWEALRCRERELIERWCEYWTPRIWQITGVASGPKPGDFQPLVYFGDGTYFEFRRGFVESIRLSWADWLKHHKAIMQVTPLREVHFTTTAYAHVYSESSQFVAIGPGACTPADEKTLNKIFGNKIKFHLLKWSPEQLPGLIDHWETPSVEEL